MRIFSRQLNTAPADDALHGWQPELAEQGQSEASWRAQGATARWELSSTVYCGGEACLRVRECADAVKRRIVLASDAGA